MSTPRRKTPAAKKSPAPRRARPKQKAASAGGQIAEAHEKARVARRAGKPADVVEKLTEKARELERETHA